MLNFIMKIAATQVLIETCLQFCGAMFAHAGAWVPKREAGYSSTGFQRDDGEFGGAWRADSYLESGLGGGWAFIGKAETLWRDEDAGDDRLAGMLSMRRSLFKKNGFVASGQLGVLVGESLEAPLCEGTGVDSRALVGWSGPLGGRKTWVNLETAFRNQGGCDRWLVDVATGLDLTENWRLEVKAFHQSGDGPKSIKLESGIARRFDEQFIGLSYRREVGGAFEEDSWILTLSRHF